MLLTVTLFFYRSPLNKESSNFTNSENYTSVLLFILTYEWPYDFFHFECWKLYCFIYFTVIMFSVNIILRCESPIPVQQAIVHQWQWPDTWLHADCQCDPVRQSPPPHPRPHPHPSFRQHFSDKCLPKHHFLEVHCSDFIADLGFGMAKLGESGIELAHQTMMQAEKCARHLGKTERGAQAVLKRHFMTGSPRLIATPCQ